MEITKRLIIFLIRKRFGLKKNEEFQFTNQTTESAYYFTSTSILKRVGNATMKSNVSINWLLDDECKIRKIKR